jgi:hypothetical protein
LKPQIEDNRDFFESADVARRIHGVAGFTTRGPQWRRRRVVAFGQKAELPSRSAAH